VKRTHTYRLVAIIFGILLLCTIEGIIRFGGWAQDRSSTPKRLIQIVEDGQVKGEIVQSSAPFFVEKDGFMETNPVYHQGIGAGFPQSGSMRRIQFQRTPSKDRYFLLGGSAALGQQPVQLKVPLTWKTIPLGNSVNALPEALSISGVLRNKLWQKGHDVELLNAGMIAQDSGGVRRFIEEILSYQPKGILLYLGNNEGIGMAYAMNGVQFSHAPEVRDFMKQFHTYRLLKQLLISQPSGSKSTLSGTRPEVLGTLTQNEWRHAGEALVEDNQPTDSVHHALMERFKTNIMAIQEACKTKGVELYIIVTPPHLLYPPFYSANSPNLSENAIQSYSRSLESSKNLQRQRKWDELLQVTTNAVSTEPNHALGWFEHGKALQAKHKRSDAMDAYEKSLSLDLSRKRTRLEYANWTVEYCKQSSCKSLSAHASFRKDVLEKGFSLYDKRFGDHEHLTPQGCAWMASLFRNLMLGNQSDSKSP